MKQYRYYTSQNISKGSFFANEMQVSSIQPNVVALYDTMELIGVVFLKEGEHIALVQEESKKS